MTSAYRHYSRAVAVVVPLVATTWALQLLMGVPGLGPTPLVYATFFAVGLAVPAPIAVYLDRTRETSTTGLRDVTRATWGLVVVAVLGGVSAGLLQGSSGAVLGGGALYLLGAWGVACWHIFDKKDKITLQYLP